MPELPHRSYIELSPTTAQRLERCRAALSARDADLIAGWPESIRPADGAYSLADVVVVAIAHLESELKAKELLDA